MRVLIYINSLNISFTEFETIVWNQTLDDDIKKRTYLKNDIYNEDVPLQLIRYLNTQMDPIFVINRWIIDVYDQKKTYDTSMFWLRVFLNDEVSAIFPPISENPTFIDSIRRMSSPVYSKLLKNIQNI